VPDPFDPKGTSQCPLFTTVLDAGKPPRLDEGWKNATCSIGEKDNDIYRCPACLAAERACWLLVDAHLARSLVKRAATTQERVEALQASFVGGLVDENAKRTDTPPPPARDEDAGFAALYMAGFRVEHAQPRTENALLREALWQAYKAFGEEGPEAAREFLGASCVRVGIMDESGARLPG
jgi:hypothetical protein